MVCLGNICRSPMAEGILQSKVDPNLVKVESAGTAAYHVGEAPDSRTILAARKHGLDLRSLRARKFEASDFDYFDEIYVMDRQNYRDVLSLAKNEEDRNKVDLILNLLHGEANQEVPDPYYGGDEGFDNVYRLLDAATDKWLEKFEKNG